MEILRDFIKALEVTQVVESFESEEWPIPQQEASFQFEPFIALGYSNGFHRALEFLYKITAQYNLGSSSIHLIGIDGVRRGGGILSPKWHITSGIKSCLHLIRSDEIEIPPYHQMIDKDEPPSFLTVRVPGTDHPSIIRSPLVRDSVCQRIVDIFRGVL